MIGLITLIGAAIGLMNIMLVSVSERTKEVGLIKAIGGKSKMVSASFCWKQLLSVFWEHYLGLFLGVLVGNLVFYGFKYRVCGALELGIGWNYYL